MQGRRLEHGAIVFQMIVVAQNYVMLISSHLPTCQRTFDSQQIAVTMPLWGGRVCRPTECWGRKVSLPSHGVVGLSRETDSTH